MAELSIYRVAVQARNKPAGTYTYVITRTDDPNWAESALESYSTPEAASEVGVDCPGSHSGSEEAGPIMTFHKRPAIRSTSARHMPSPFEEDECWPTIR
jgi:hypothetical protein